MHSHSSLRFNLLSWVRGVGVLRKVRGERKIASEYLEDTPVNAMAERHWENNKGGPA